jgi:ferrous iron transport protein A
LTTNTLHRPIDALAVGEVALIAAIDRAGLDPSTAQRLCELGFDEGVDVEILHRAPFGGDPLAVRPSSAASPANGRWMRSWPWWTPPICATICVSCWN